MESTPLAQPDVSAEKLKPDTTSAPELLLILLPTKSGGLSDAMARVSRDVTSAHAFAQAFLLNKFPYLYTPLKVTGISRPPVPEIVYLAMAQKKPWDLRSMGMGLFQTIEEAKDACGVMAEKDPEFTAFEIKTCVVQLGLTEEDDEYLDELTQRAVTKELEALEQGDSDKKESEEKESDKKESEEKESDKKESDKVGGEQDAN